MESEKKYKSNGGDYVFHTWAWEARMSHWIESFALVDVASGRSLIAFKDSNWSLEQALWLSSSVVRFSVRKYPGDHTPSEFEVEADCATLLAHVQGGAEIPFSEIEPTLDALYRRSPSA
jgi:hypothetical protein